MKAIDSGYKQFTRLQWESSFGVEIGVPNGKVGLEGNGKDKDKGDGPPGGGDGPPGAQ